jgi:hypothetical protein
MGKNREHATLLTAPCVGRSTRGTSGGWGDASTQTVFEFRHRGPTRQRADARRRPTRKGEVSGITNTITGGTQQ